VYHLGDEFISELSQAVSTHLPQAVATVPQLQVRNNALFMFLMLPHPQLAFAGAIHPSQSCRRASSSCS
jgi:hypothetical protein